MFARAMFARHVWTFPLVLMLYALSCALIGFATLCKLLLGKLRT